MTDVDKKYERRKCRRKILPAVPRDDAARRSASGVAFFGSVTATARARETLVSEVVAVFFGTGR